MLDSDDALCAKEIEDRPDAASEPFTCSCNGRHGSINIMVQGWYCCLGTAMINARLLSSSLNVIRWGAFFIFHTRERELSRATLCARQHPKSKIENARDTILPLNNHTKPTMPKVSRKKASKSTDVIDSLGSPGEQETKSKEITEDDSEASPPPPVEDSNADVQETKSNDLPENDSYDIMLPSGLGAANTMDCTLMVEVSPQDASTLDYEGVTGAIGRFEANEHGGKSSLGYLDLSDIVLYCFMRPFLTVTVAIHSHCGFEGPSISGQHIARTYSACGECSQRRQTQGRKYYRRVCYIE